MDDAVLTRLMTWLSPSYPVGAYAFSHGIEWAVEAGDITDRESLRSWIVEVLTSGSGRNDAILFAHAHRAVAAGDAGALAEVCELAAAFATSVERHLETTSQGAAFVAVTAEAWPCAALGLLSGCRDGQPAYPVAVAAAACGHDVALRPALTAYLHAFAANLVSAGLRLIPLGQTDGQRAVAGLMPVVEEVRDGAVEAALDDLGGSAWRADMAAMHHEIQTTRLFRS